MYFEKSEQVGKSGENLNSDFWQSKRIIKKYIFLDDVKTQKKNDNYGDDDYDSSDECNVRDIIIKKII